MSTPKVAAHRGFKAKHAENTLKAFEGAVSVGADIIETDVQVTSDGVVVINHDPHTGRVYDRKLTISETSLEELKKLTNVNDPTQKILTLVEFLEWFVEKPLELQVMLDIKATNDVAVLAKIIRALLDVNEDREFWYKKVIFGLWRLDFYKFGVETALLTNFPIINITVSPIIARGFISYSATLPDSFKLNAVSLLTAALYAPEFRDFYEKSLNPNDINLYTWTANSTTDFRVALHWNAYGLITDNPDKAIEFIKESQDKPAQETDTLIPSQFELPSIFTSEGFRLNLKVQFLRVFEFLIVNNLLRHRPVQLAFFALARFVIS